jgi:hypothetical protein
MKHTIIGTSHFESKFKAQQYYTYGGYCNPQDVQDKIDRGEISIGQPKLSDNETCNINSEGRYIIYREIKVTYPPLEKLDCSRGAPMGRVNVYPINRSAPIKFYLRKVRLDSGGYDSGNAYWGHGTETLYRAVCPDVQKCSDFSGYWESARMPEIFVWAKTRKEALDEITKTLTKATTR